MVIQNFSSAACTADESECFEDAEALSCSAVDSSGCIDKKALKRRAKNALMTHLKFLRKRRGLTLEALSEATGISISYLSRLESGSRRLNTDLIRRLSKTFGCDPSELLHDVTHDETSFVDFDEPNKKIRSGYFASFGSRRGIDPIRKGFHPVELQCDLPIFSLKATETGIKILETTAPSGHRHRPMELLGQKEAFALNVGSHFNPYFGENSVILLNTSHGMSPEATVVVVLESGEVLLKKVWSITPTSIQVCDIDKIEVLKRQSSVKDTSILTEFNKSELKAIYRVVGHYDIEVAA